MTLGLTQSTLALADFDSLLDDAMIPDVDRVALRKAASLAIQASVREALTTAERERDEQRIRAEMLSDQVERWRSVAKEVGDDLDRLRSTLREIDTLAARMDLATATRFARIREMVGRAVGDGGSNG